MEGQLGLVSESHMSSCQTIPSASTARSAVVSTTSLLLDPAQCQVALKLPTDMQYGLWIMLLLKAALHEQLCSALAHSLSA